jgi:hypothetical protein
MIGNMWEDDPRRDSFEELLRSIAREVSQAADRVAEIDYDELARSFGLDVGSVKHWIDEAGGWLREQAEGATRPEPNRTPRQTPHQQRDEGPRKPPEDPLGDAGPHPLDLPTDEQGLALAALESGRWTIEPGADALASRGEGPGPRDALGLVRELRVRDWISCDGELTLAGRGALGRWLEAAIRR